MVNPSPSKKQYLSISINSVLLWAAVSAALVIAVLALVKAAEKSNLPANMDDLATSLASDYDFAVNGSPMTTPKLTTPSFELMKGDGAIACTIDYAKVGGGTSIYATQLNIGDTPFWIRGSLADARYNFGKGNDDLVQFVKTRDTHKDSYWAFTDDGTTAEKQQP